MTSWREEKQTDTAIETMMRACADDEGAILLESYGHSTPQPLPEGLDDQCRRLIEKNFSRRQSRVVVNHIVKTVCMTLLCLFGLLGVGTVTVMSVESLREPVLRVFENYVTYQNESFLMIHGDKTPTKPTDNNQPSVQESGFGSQMQSICKEVIPDEYKMLDSSHFTDDICIGIYKNDHGNKLFFSGHPLDGVVKINTEGSELIEGFDFHGHTATWIIDYDNYVVKLHWIDEDQWMQFGIDSTGMTQDEVLDLAERFYAKLKDQPMNEQSEQGR